MGRCERRKRNEANDLQHPGGANEFVSVCLREEWSHLAGAV